MHQSFPSLLNKMLLPIEFPCFCGGEDPNEASSSLILLLYPPQRFDLHREKNVDVMFRNNPFSFMVFILFLIVTQMPCHTL